MFFQKRSVISVGDLLVVEWCIWRYRYEEIFFYSNKITFGLRMINEFVEFLVGVVVRDDGLTYLFEVCYGEDFRLFFADCFLKL